MDESRAPMTEARLREIEAAGGLRAGQTIDLIALDLVGEIRRLQGGAPVMEPLP